MFKIADSVAVSVESTRKRSRNLGSSACIDVARKDKAGRSFSPSNLCCKPSIITIKRYLVGVSRCSGTAQTIISYSQRCYRRIIKTVGYRHRFNGERKLGSAERDSLTGGHMTVTCCRCSVVGRIVDGYAGFRIGTRQRKLICTRSFDYRLSTGEADRTKSGHIRIETFILYSNRLNCLSVHIGQRC